MSGIQKIIYGTSYTELSENVTRVFNLPVVKCSISKFSNDEIKVVILDELKSDDRIFIFQTGASTKTFSINDIIIETLMIIDICKKSAIKNITLVMPYLPYSRQDKFHRNQESIAARLFANMLECAGISNIICIDLHSPQLEGFFNIPVKNVLMCNFLVDYIKHNILYTDDLSKLQSDYLLAAPDSGAAKNVENYSDQLQIDYITCMKERNYKVNNLIDKMCIVGSVNKIKNKQIIIIDDMCDTGSTILKCASLFMEHGAKSVISIFTHGILSGNAADRFNKSNDISKLYVCNTIDQTGGGINKICVIDIYAHLKQVIL